MRAPNRAGKSTAAVLTAALAVAALGTGAVPAAMAAGEPATVAAGDSGSATWHSTNWNGPGTPVRLSDVAKTIGARTGLATGLDGKGIGVALIDTGVLPVRGLPANRIVNGPDLSFESQAANLRYLDTYGHGSHMAGIIAGEALAYGFQGIAPGVKLTSVKVGTARGVVDVTQIIAAVDWVVAHRNDDPANPIRVINLSYGTGGTQDPTIDPLSTAVENAWRAGIVVVVAGGNDGNSAGKLTTPATNRFVLSVGSAVTYDTLDQFDDTVSNFTSLAAGQNINLVAPGESIESIRVPGSYLDTTYPGARTYYDNFKGSGTSQAAAVVSGAVALVLQKRPTLKPDQVKALLTSTAVKIAKGAAAGSGVGEINVAAALAATTPTTTQTGTRATGKGALEKSRGGTHVVRNGKVLSGENDLFGPLSSASWATASAGGTAWNKGVWMGHRLAGDGWTGSSWASRTWAAATWPTGYWGDAAWSDSTWTGRFWSGTAWSTGEWSGRFWSSDNWSSATW